MVFQSSTAWGLDGDCADPWQVRAKCRNADPEEFHPVGEPTPWQIEAALSFCRSCPVMLECREHALDVHKSRSDLWWVWGGLTQAEMRHLFADRVREQRDQMMVTCRRCGEVGLKLDGRRLCVDCFHT